jgi:Domain of unknown function (DUF4136)
MRFKVSRTQEINMLRTVRAASACLIVAFVFAAQTLDGKAKVDFDRAAEFDKFKTYQWAQLDPVRMPFLRLTILGSIDHELQAKGLTKVTSDADLIVSYSGDIAGEANHGVSAPAYPGYAGPPPSVNSTMWTGAGTAGTAVTYPKGTLVVELMNPQTGDITWRGMTKVKLDMEQKSKSLERVNERITEMFTQYPPPGRKRASR